MPDTAIEKVPEFAVVVVVALEVVVGGSSADVPTVAEEAVVDVAVVEAVVEVDVVFVGVVAEVATDVVGEDEEVFVDVPPAPVAVPVLAVDVVAAPVVDVLAPVAELVLAVEEAPQAVSAVIIAQQEILTTVSILFRTVTPRRTARKFELCEMYSGCMNDEQYVSQRRLSRRAVSAIAQKTLTFKHQCVCRKSPPANSSFDESQKI